jgi:microcystin-dependent protein
MYLTLLTNYGQARLATAIATGVPLNLTTLVVGDGSGSPTTPATSQTALVNQVHSVSLNSVSVDSGNPNYVIAEGVIPAAVGGWTIREAGIRDNTGALFAVCNFPDTIKPILTDGSVRDLVIRVIMQVSNAAAVTLLIDPSVVLASQSWVLTQGYLPKSGGTMTGHITQPLAPTLGEHVPNKDYVDAKTGVDSIPIGLIDHWPSATPPASFLICDGSAINRTTYATLFSKIGTTFGAGNGTTTFNIPTIAASGGVYYIIKALLLTNVDSTLLNQAANTYCRLDGTVDMTGRQKLSADPTHALHGSTKQYADAVAAAAQAASQPLLGFTPLNKAGDTATGQINVPATPINSTSATPKAYVDTADALKLNLSGGTMSGDIAMGGGRVTNSPNTAKAWVNINGTTGAIRASENVSSVTKNGTGDYTVNFSASIADTSYAVALGSVSVGVAPYIVSQATGNCRIGVFDTYYKTAADSTICAIVMR